MQITVCVCANIVGFAPIAYDIFPTALQCIRRNCQAGIRGHIIFVFMHIGKIYLDELKWRKDLFKANESLLDAAKRIEGLEKELRTEREMNML